MECAIKETTSKFKEMKGCWNYAPSSMPQLHPCTLTKSMSVNYQSIIHYSKKTKTVAPENYYETCDTKKTGWSVGINMPSKQTGYNEMSAPYLPVHKTYYN
jgi:hypothetical protein